MSPSGASGWRRIRWWPAALILLAAVAGLLYVWVFGNFDLRQRQVVQTLKVVLVSGLLFALWLLFASRLPWRLRLALLAAGLALVVGLRATLEVRGVTGDLIPILAWRWSESEAGDEVGVGRAVLAPAGTPSFPQFLGSRRDGTLRGPELARDWHAQPPVEIWRRPVGEGWAGFAVARGLAVTLEQHGDEERVVAYDLATGEPRWSHSDEALYDNTVGGVGPRTVPTIVGETVYTVGATGILNALDLATGRELWRHDTVAEHDGSIGDWGKAISPLVTDGLVLVSPGGSVGPTLVAYDAEDGELRWQAGDDESSYSSPLLTTLAGRRQVVLLSRNQVAGYDPEGGGVLWTTPWPNTQPNVAQPLVLGDDRLLVSAGYGIGAKLYRIGPGSGPGEVGGDGLVAETIWRSPRLKSKFANYVEHEGAVYGLDDGVLVCLDLATGDRRWKRGRYGHGQLLLVGDLLLVQTEKGEIVLIEPDPEGLRELGSFPVFDGKTWNPPALAGDLLVLRTHREAVALRLPLAEGAAARTASLPAADGDG